MRVASLHRHPLKGGAIEDCEHLELAPEGPVGDRRWMIVDGNGRFLSQRELPRLATVGAKSVGEELDLGLGDEKVRARSTANRADVVVWRDTVSATVADDGANDALSAYLGRDVRLVAMNNQTKRTMSGAFASGQVSFADGYPILVALTASLDALNDQIALRGRDRVPMARFRPNIVIEGATAWVDDSWEVVRIGNAELRFVKPCDRCTVTTVDQRSGSFSGEEPLATLRQIRMSGDPRISGVLFGWNVVSSNCATISVGDPCEVISTREAWPIKERHQIA